LPAKTNGHNLIITKKEKRKNFIYKIYFILFNLTYNNNVFHYNVEYSFNPDQTNLPITV